MADKLLFVKEAWRKLTRREKVIMVITLISAVSALIYQFPYTTLEKRTAKLRSTIETTEKEILDKTLQIANLKIRAKSGPVVSPGWELADQKSAVLLLEDVSGEAKHIGVSLIAVHPSQELEKEKYKEISMNLDLKGRYRELGEYFKRLEDLSKIVNIRKVRIESCPDSASVCAAQIEAVTYLAK